MIGGLFRTIGPFAPPPPPGAQPPPLWGSEDHLRELFGDRVEWRTLERDVLEVTAFERPSDFAEHFKPALRAGDRRRRTTPRNEDREAGVRGGDRRLLRVELNLGSADDARFEMEYLVAVGRRAS